MPPNDDRRPAVAVTIKAHHVAVIDGCELTVRIMEALIGLPRPKGHSAESLIEAAKDTDSLAVAQAAATVALQYFLEVTEGAHPEHVQ